MNIDYEKLRERLVMAFNGARAGYETDKGKGETYYSCIIYIKKK